MASPKQELHASFDAAVIAAVTRWGPAFDKTPIIKDFVGRGVNQATAYRWFESLMKSGRPGLVLADSIAADAEARAARVPEPAVEAAHEVVAIIPAVPRVETMISIGAGPVIDELGKCIKAAHDLMAHARHGDGKPKNAKLLLSASEHLRRSTETMIRLQEMMASVIQVEAFHRAVFDVLREQDPKLVEGVLRRLRQLNEQWRMGQL